MIRHAIVHKTPPFAPPPKPVSLSNLVVEWRIGLEMARLPLASWQLARAPRGDATVILIPGWLAPEMCMSPLKRYLSTKGYDARHWGFGTNQGHPGKDSRRMVEKLLRDPALAKRKIALVGWSLGGIIAREVARTIPDRISGIVTFGSPVVGGPSHTPVADTWGPAACASIAVRQAELERKHPIKVPIANIYSKRDEIVSWPACIDRTSPNVTHYEVNSPHIAMGLDPAVWLVVANELHGFGKSL